MEKKSNIVIFLEQHDYDFSIKEHAKKELEAEGRQRVCVLVEETPYSMATKVLKSYSEELKKITGSCKNDSLSRGPRGGGKAAAEAIGEYRRANYERLRRVASRNQWWWEAIFKRELDLIDAAHASYGPEVEVAAIDCRRSKKILEDFIKQDRFLNQRFNELPEVGKKGVFEEHALGAWYVKDQIQRYEDRFSCDKFLLTVGVDHSASLAAYLKDKNPRFIKLPFRKGEKLIDPFELSPDNQAVLEYHKSSAFSRRLYSFFLPEFEDFYCIHCGGLKFS